MNIISFFDGMSCGQLALQRAGIEVDNYFASEVDKYAMQVATANFPNTIHIGDITKVLRSVLPLILSRHKIGAVIGGSPCQGFSFCGKQEGASAENKEDETVKIEITTLKQYQQLREKGFEFIGQSYLFWEYVELLQIIRAYNPDVKFLLENVRMKQKWKDVITEALGVEPIAINSNLVSAQNRYRLYWTNIPNVTQPEDRGLVIKDIIEVGHKGAPVKDTERNRRHYRKHTDKALCALATMYKGAGNNGMTLINSCIEVGHAELNGHKSPTLTAVCGGNQERKIAVDAKHWRKLTPIECERLQTVPDNYTAHVSNTQRYKMLGNGWTVDVIAHILRGLKGE